MLPLLNPVLSLSTELEEEDDEPPLFHAQNNVVKHMYEDEEVDVVVIDSRENDMMDNCYNQTSSMSRGTVSLEDKMGKKCKYFK